MFKRGLPDTPCHQQAYVFPNYFQQVHSLWGKDREGAGAGKGLRKVKGHNSCDQGGKARLSLRAACEDRGSHGRDINPAPTPTGAGQSLPARSKQTSHLSCFDDGPRGGHCG